jgi:cytidine deaminase
MAQGANELIRLAKETVKPRQLSSTVCVGEVAVALISGKGNTHTGVSIDIPSGIGFCAEQNAIGTMITNGESKVVALAAVNWDGDVVSPSGRCREFIYQVDPANAETLIILASGRPMTLRELLPEHWDIPGEGGSPDISKSS